MAAQEGLLSRQTTKRRTFAVVASPSLSPILPLDAMALCVGPPQQSLGSSNSSIARRARGTACEPCRKAKVACKGQFPCDR